MPANPDHSADEPTEEMLRAMSQALDPVIHGGFEYHRARLVAAYHALRAARPEAQAAPKLTADRIESCRAALRDAFADPRTGSMPEFDALCDAALASLHAQAGVSGDEQQAEHSGSASQGARSPE